MQFGRGAAIVSALTAACLLPQSNVRAAEPSPTVGALTGIAPPAQPSGQYGALVKNKRWLVALGKALFWDAAVGSDGVACASCHFNAGADPRLKNQLDPGLRMKPLGDTTFGDAGGLMASGGPAGPNLTLKATDFPFHQLENPYDRESRVVYDTNDVASSQGAVKGAYIGLRYIDTKVRRRDLCKASDDTVFQITIDGVAKPIDGFRLDGEREAGASPTSVTVSMASPLVGRDREMALLFERWAERNPAKVSRFTVRAGPLRLPF